MVLVRENLAVGGFGFQCAADGCVFVACVGCVLCVCYVCIYCVVCVRCVASVCVCVCVAEARGSVEVFVGKDRRAAGEVRMEGGGRQGGVRQQTDVLTEHTGYTQNLAPGPLPPPP